MINNKNTKDIFIRNAIAGVLDYLNRNVGIIQVVDDVENEYEVKFYYNFGQDEQFMKDFFVNLDHGCKVHQNAEGNFDKRPVGVIKFSSFSIRPNDITNRFIRGTFINEGYTDNNEKKLKAYSAYLMRIPITIKIDVDVQADNLGQAMRIIEAALSTIYKSNVMYFQFRGMRIPAEVLMSDSEDLEKKTEFTYDDNQIAHAKFGLDVNTSFPSFDESSVRAKANAIREFRLSLYTDDGHYGESHVLTEQMYIEGLVVDKLKVITVPYDYGQDNPDRV